jgi:hypothetical protein
VAACLQCHAGNSEIMKRTMNLGLDFILPNISKACILPENF